VEGCSREYSQRVVEVPGLLALGQHEHVVLVQRRQKHIVVSMYQYMSRKTTEIVWLATPSSLQLPQILHCREYVPINGNTLALDTSRE